MLNLNEWLQYGFDHLIIVRVCGLNLCVYFKIGLNDDFAFEVTSLSELWVFVVEGELVEVVTDNKLWLIDSFQ